MEPRLIRFVFAAALLGACVGDGEPLEPDAAPASDALLPCVECEFGWFCDVQAIGWRCWAGTREACAPHPDDPVCEPAE